MSPNLTYYTHLCLGPEVPESVVRETATGRLVQIIEDNTWLVKRVEKYELGERKYLNIDVGNGMKAKVKMVLPHGYRQVNMSYSRRKDIRYSNIFLK